jgi:hypothetical protein
VGTAGGSDPAAARYAAQLARLPTAVRPAVWRGPGPGRRAPGVGLPADRQVPTSAASRRISVIAATASDASAPVARTVSRCPLAPLAHGCLLWAPIYSRPESAPMNGTCSASCPRDRRGVAYGAPAGIRIAASGTTGPAGPDGPGGSGVPSRTRRRPAADRWAVDAAGQRHEGGTDRRAAQAGYSLTIFMPSAVSSLSGPGALAAAGAGRLSAVPACWVLPAAGACRAAPLPPPG